MNILFCFQHSGKKNKTQMKKHERVSYSGEVANLVVI